MFSSLFTQVLCLFSGLESTCISDLRNVMCLSAWLIRWPKLSFAPAAYATKPFVCVHYGFVMPLCFVNSFVDSTMVKRVDILHRQNATRFRKDDSEMISNSRPEILPAAGGCRIIRHLKIWMCHAFLTFLLDCEEAEIVWNLTQVSSVYRNHSIDSSFAMGWQRRRSTLASMALGVLVAEISLGVSREGGAIWTNFNLAWQIWVEKPGVRHVRCNSKCKWEHSIATTCTSQKKLLEVKWSMWKDGEWWCSGSKNGGIGHFPRHVMSSFSLQVPSRPYPRTAQPAWESLMPCIWATLPLHNVQGKICRWSLGWRWVVRRQKRWRTLTFDSPKMLPLMCNFRTDTKSFVVCLGNSKQGWINPACPPCQGAVHGVFQWHGGSFWPLGLKWKG